VKKIIGNITVVILIQSIVLTNFAFCGDVLPQKNKYIDCLSPGLNIDSSFLQQGCFQFSESLAKSIFKNISTAISKDNLLPDIKKRIKIILEYGPYDLQEMQRLNALLKEWLPQNKWPKNVSHEITNFLMIILDLKEIDLVNILKVKMPESVLQLPWYGDFNDGINRKPASEGYSVNSPTSEWIKTENFKLKEKNILIDLSCGNGEKTLSIAKRNPQAIIYGWDLYAPNIAQGIQSAACNQIQNVKFRIQDVRKPNREIKDDSVSAVTLLYMPTYQFSLKDKTDTFKHILRMLKVGGRVYFDYDYDNSLKTNKEANYERAVDFFLDIAKQEGVGVKKNGITEERFIVEILSKPKIKIQKNKHLHNMYEQDMESIDTFLPDVILEKLEEIQASLQADLLGTELENKDISLLDNATDVNPRYAYSVSCDKNTKIILMAKELWDSDQVTFFTPDTYYVSIVQNGEIIGYGALENYLAPKGTVTMSFRIFNEYRHQKDLSKKIFKTLMASAREVFGSDIEKFLLMFHQINNPKGIDSAAVLFYLKIGFEIRDKKALDFWLNVCKPKLEKGQRLSKEEIEKISSTNLLFSIDRIPENSLEADLISAPSFEIYSQAAALINQSI